MDGATLLHIDRRPAGVFVLAALARRTRGNPIAKHYTAHGFAAPLHVLTIGRRWAVVVLWQRPAPEAAATADADRSGARPCSCSTGCSGEAAGDGAPDPELCHECNGHGCDVLA